MSEAANTNASWYVVYTQLRAEERALWHLRNQGFECFLPRCQKVRRHARKTQTVLEPLFPRYLFTRLDLKMSRWRAINGSRGVIQLLSDGTRPMSVSGGIVEQLLNETDEDGVTPLSVLGMFWKGREVQIKCGPFSGQFGVVSEVFAEGKDRVEILLSMLGARVNLRMPAHALETA